MASTAPWTDAMDRALLEGDWVREQLIQTFMPLVPPGLAFRHSETRRDYDRNNKARKTERRMTRKVIPAGDPLTVAVGQRAKVVESLITSLAGERYRQWDDDGVQWLGAGPNIVRGPAKRIALVRHSQSECHARFPEPTTCPWWSKHVAEALALKEAYEDH